MITIGSETTLPDLTFVVADRLGVNKPDLVQLLYQGRPARECEIKDLVTFSVHTPGLKGGADSGVTGAVELTPPREPSGPPVQISVRWDREVRCVLVPDKCSVAEATVAVAVAFQLKQRGRVRVLSSQRVAWPAGGYLSACG